jgi:hypothetical protein
MPTWLAVGSRAPEPSAMPTWLAAELAFLYAVGAVPAQSKRQPSYTKRGYSVMPPSTNSVAPVM